MFSDLNPYLKLFIWFLMGCFYLALAIGLRKKLNKLFISNVHSLPKNPTVVYGIFIGVIVLITAVFFVKIYSSNQTSDILNAIILAINVLVAYAAISLIDIFDLKKGFKGEQHKCIVEFVNHFSSIWLTIIIYNEKVTYKTNQLSVDLISEVWNDRTKSNIKNRIVYFDQRLFNKLNLLKRSASHAYFPYYDLYYKLNSLKFVMHKFSKSINNSLIFCDHEDNAILTKEFVKDRSVIYSIYFLDDKENEQQVDFESIISILLEMCDGIEDYYNQYFPEFMPMVFRRKGHTYL